MSREQDILSGIDEMNGFDFQKLARRLLQREHYPNLNPLPDQDDLGQDARTEELPVTELPNLGGEDGRITFAMSKTTTRDKLTRDCNRCQEVGHDIDTFVFVTSGEVTNDLQTDWKEYVREEYGWDLVIYERTFFSDIATKPEHEKLIEELLGIPPLGGDYYEDIVDKFNQITEETLSGLTAILPHMDRRIDRGEVSEIQSQLSSGVGVVVSGDAGVGKTGVLQQAINRWGDGHVLFIDARRFSECTNQTELRQEFDFSGSLSDAIKRVGRYDRCFLVVDQLDNIGGTPASGLLADILEEVVDSEGVHVLVACREWDLDNRREYQHLRAAEDSSFTTVSISKISREAVEDVLADLRISDYSNQLVSLGRNLLNLSIIVELKFLSDEEIDFTEIKRQVELWDRYQETLVERETRGGEWDERSGEEVRARAVELAQSGLRDGSRVFPISLRRERADKRLISRNVLVHELGERYRFRHEELQDYFYAWDAVNRLGWTTPNQVLEDIDERVAAGIFRWMLRMLQRQGRDQTMEFIDDSLSEDGLSYYAASNVLDEIKSWNPNEIEDDILELVVDKIETREELLRYFYEDLSNTEWVSVLQQQGRFDDPHGPLLGYLEKVAGEVPELVVEIIETTETENEGKRAFLIQIAENLPPEYAVETIDRFQEWLPNATIEIGPYNVHYTNFIESLLEKNEPEAALELLDSILEPQHPDPDVIEYEAEDGEPVERKFGSDATALANTYTLETVVENVRDNLPSGYEEDFIELLETNLRTAIHLEANELGVTPDEISWPPRVDGLELNNTKLKEVLLESLRDYLTAWVNEHPDRDECRSLIDEYLEDILLFKRLGLFFLRSHPDTYSELVEEQLLDDSNYDDIRIQYEFFTLLQEGFPVLGEERERVLEIIDEGIEPEEAQRRAGQLQDRFPDDSVDEIAEALNERWKLKRFWMIRDDLSPVYLDQVEEFVDRYGEPDQPELVIRHEGGSVSFVGPMQQEELRQLSPEEILELCVEWDPTDDDDEDFLTEVSPRGLGNDLKSLVEESPQQFVPYLNILAEADSIYIYHAFDGLRGAIDKNHSFEWNTVLDLCSEAVNRSDSWGRETRQITCRLIRKGIQETDLIKDHTEDVKNILLALSGDPDPGLDDDQDFIPHEDPIRTAINSVRPIALNSLIVYALERANQDGYEGFDEEQESGLEPEIREVLLERLTDPSTAVHSVYGQRIKNLRWLDEEIIADNVETIFPTGNGDEAIERFGAAWAAYLSVNNWDPQTYNLLRKYYFYAIDLHEEEGRFAGHNQGQGLVAHTLCTYLFGEEDLEDEDSHIVYFYNHTSSDKAGDASWQLMRWGNDEPEFKENWEQVSSLWKWRLNEVAGDPGDHGREFEWFVEWIDIMEDQIAPEEIDGLLIRTIPLVSQRRRVWDTLEEYLTLYVDDDPLTCIQIYAELIAQTDWPQYRSFREETRTILESALESGGEAREIALEATETIAEQDSDFLDLLREYSLE